MALVGGSIIFSLLVLEGMARLLLTEKPLQLAEPDPYIGSILKKNLDLLIPAENGKGKVRLKTNSAGFIGDEWASEKKGIRIANLGDSFTAGIAVPFEKNYSTLLGHMLEDRLKTPVESMNFGVGGQGTGKELKTYQHYARKTDPDLVIVWIYTGNDLNDNLEEVLNEEGPLVIPAAPSASSRNWNPAEAVINGSELVKIVKKALTHSEFAHRVFNRLLAIRPIEGLMRSIAFSNYAVPGELRLTFTRSTPQDFERALLRTKDNLRTLKKETTKNGSELFAVIIPNQLQIDPDSLARLFVQYPELADMDFDSLKPNRALASILIELSISYFDVTEDFATQCGNGSCSLYVCRYCHLSEEGHRFTAERVADEIYRRTIIKTPR